MTEKMSDTPTYEDIAIDAFCNRLACIEGIKVDIIARPDDRGRLGRSECDAIIRRDSTQFSLEHTSLMTYRSEKGGKTKRKHEVLIKRYITPLGIENLIRAAYPNQWVNIYLPIDSFDMKFRYEQTFNRLRDRLVDAVAQTPEFRLIEETKEFRFEDIPFPILISREPSDTTNCFITYLVLTNREQTHENLKNEIVRAVERKRDKLKHAKEQGAQTILLMDSDDINFVNLRFLAKAFGEATPRVDLKDIDEIFVMHAPQVAPWVAPVKIGDRLYPNLPEFQEYIEFQINHRS